MIDGGMTATGSGGSTTYSDVFEAVFGKSAAAISLLSSGNVAAQMSAGALTGIDNDGILWAPATATAPSSRAAARSMAPAVALAAALGVVWLAWRSGAFR